MTKFKNLLAGSLAFAALAVAGTANAITVSDGTAQNFSWSYALADRNLTGTGSFTVTGFSSNSLTITFTLNNTGTIAGQGGDRLTAFGFGIDPNATGVTFSDASDGGIIDAGLFNGNIGNGIIVEVCAWGGQNCNGGGNGGLEVGDSDTFSILLAGTWGTSVNIDPLALKYQTGSGSYEFTASSSTSTSSTGGSGNQVPEPGTLGLLGLGLVGLAYGRRRLTQSK